MLTVDFTKFPVKPGDRVLDLGCGAGRHAFEAYRRGARVVAADLDVTELPPVGSMFAAMREAGEAGPQAAAGAVSADATNLPFPDGAFDAVIVAEILEHIPGDTAALAEIARVLRPGGTVAVTVPAWLPERICWALVPRVPRGARRSRADLHPRRAHRQARRGGAHADGRAPRARPALGLLVAQVRGRRARRRAPRRAGVPPAARLGHHERARAHPAVGGRAQPAHRQEPGDLREKGGNQETDHTERFRGSPDPRPVSTRGCGGVWGGRPPGQPRRFVGGVWGVVPPGSLGGSSGGSGGVVPPGKQSDLAGSGAGE